MVVVGVDSPSQDVVVGVVLVTAVALDSALQAGRRTTAMGPLGVGLIVSAIIIPDWPPLTTSERKR